MRNVVIFCFALIAPWVSTFSLAAGPYEGTLSDAHDHVKGGVQLERIITEMDKADVDAIVITRRDTKRFDIGDHPPVTDQELIAFRKRHPKRVLLGFGLQITRWRKKDATLIDEIRSQARTGNYSLIGEVGLRGGGGTGRKLFVSPSDPLFHQLLDLAAETHLPVLLHHTNIKPDEFEQLKAAFRSRPEVTVIWAHWCGMSRPDQVRELFTEFPNLHCDLAWLHKAKKTFHVALVDSDFHFLPEWKALIEEYPDRFLVGADVTRAEDYDRYPQFINHIRTALGSLSPATAHRVATENFHHILLKD